MQAFNVKKYLNFTHNKIYNDRHKGICAIGTAEISQVLVCAYTTKDISQSSVLLIFLCTLINKINLQNRAHFIMYY